MYDWRKASPEERARILSERKRKGLPWHSPPHLEGLSGLYHVCAACYQHEPHIGASIERLQNFSDEMLETLKVLVAEIYAWCVVLNHYHILVRIEIGLSDLTKGLGKLHGRTSFKWNGDEKCRGRKVWCNSIDRWIRDDRHFWTALNYIHHNPVKHELVQKWQSWPFSSARDYVEKVGREKAKDVWMMYPVKGYGDQWLGRDL